MYIKLIARKIIQLKKNDESLRNKLVASRELSDGYHKEMEALHNRNALELSRIIDEIGYPTAEKVGEEASEAAWLIIQHAISQPEFMKKCALQMEEAVSEDKAHLRRLAYLTDRIAVFEGKKQWYGTHFDWNEHGEMSPSPIEDISQVNERRKSIGLNSLEEQIEMMKKQVAEENHHPPADILERKQAYDDWRRRVGWIK